MSIPSLDLQAWDVLLYRPSSIFGQFIKWHTGQPISHVEVFIGRELIARYAPTTLVALDNKWGAGTQYSTASRDRLGVDFYPARIDKYTAYQLRPNMEATASDERAAMACALALRGTPYGWLDLANFFGFGKNGPGVVCSPYATAVLRSRGLALFNGIQARLVSPAMFRSCERLPWLWADGNDAAIDAAGI